MWHTGLGLQAVQWLYKQTRPFQKKFYFEVSTPFDVEPYLFEVK